MEICKTLRILKLLTKAILGHNIFHAKQQGHGTGQRGGRAGISIARASSAHHIPPPSQSLRHSPTPLPFSPAHFAWLLPPLPPSLFLPPATWSLPSLPTPCLVTFHSLHPHLSRAPGAGNLPCLIPWLQAPRALNIHDREKHFTANWTHSQLERQI